MTTFIAIVGAKGGVGKTTTAINLASALTQFSRNTIVVDCHLQKPNVGLYLGYTHTPKNITNALKGKHKVSEAIYLHPSGIHVVPADMAIDAIKHKFDKDHIAQTLTDLVYKSEIILVDTPSDFTDMQTIVHACDAVIYLTTPDLVSMTDTLKAMELLKPQQKKTLGVVVAKNKGKSYETELIDIESLLNMPIIGNIPYDDEISRAQNQKYPVVYANTDAASTIAYKKLAANLIGEPYEHGKEENESFWSYLFMRLGLRNPK